MTKEQIEKISQPYATLDINEVSADEKKHMLDVLDGKGFTVSTFYLRFFQKGFSAWELMGVKECKRQFLLLPDVAKTLLEYSDESDPDAQAGDKGYLYTLAQSDGAGIFYDCLKKANKGLCTRFGAFMNERGMSLGTVIRRFTADTWRVWEQEGMRSVVSQFLDNDSDNSAK